MIDSVSNPQLKETLLSDWIFSSKKVSRFRRPICCESSEESVRLKFVFISGTMAWGVHESCQIPAPLNRRRKGNFSAFFSQLSGTSGNSSDSEYLGLLSSGEVVHKSTSFPQARPLSRRDGHYSQESDSHHQLSIQSVFVFFAATNFILDNFGLIRRMRHGYAYII